MSYTVTVFMDCVLTRLGAVYGQGVLAKSQVDQLTRFLIERPAHDKEDIFKERFYQR